MSAQRADGSISSQAVLRLERLRTQRHELVPVTVVVLTRGRTGLLRRALASLARQRWVRLDVLFVIDDCPRTLAYAGTLSPPGEAIRALRILYVPRVCEASGPVRVATLRETALQAVETRWVSFLDDDNVVASDHLARLLETARVARSPVAHSWRTLWTRDGRPFRLADRHPWSRDPEVARKQFAIYEAAGIYRRSSNLVRDQVVPGQRDVSMVDTSEWLFATSFLGTFEFCKDYSADDWENARAEDNKLLDQIVEQRVAVPCTRHATLRYYLGGYSNNPRAEGAGLEGWLLSSGSTAEPAWAQVPG